jgi:lysophospholipase L1-like esterase
MGTATSMQSWHFAVETYNALLLISMGVNLIVLASGAAYLYKTRYILRSWYAYHVLGIVADKRKEEMPPPFYKMRLEVFDLLRQKTRPQKAILFVGDSLTNFFEWSEFFQNSDHSVVLNRGVSGTGVEFLTERFEEIFLTGYNVQKMFIMIGINDIRQQSYDIDKFIAHYSALLDRLLKYFDSTQICIQSILPSRATNINSEKTKVANAQIQALAHSKSICYLDLFGILADDNGYLDEKYGLGGVYLSAQGYRLWMEQIGIHLTDVPGFSSYTGETALAEGYLRPDA